jgi:hypothetical protein
MSECFGGGTKNAPQAKILIPPQTSLPNDNTQKNRISPWMSNLLIVVTQTESFRT